MLRKTVTVLVASLAHGFVLPMKPAHTCQSSRAAAQMAFSFDELFGSVQSALDNVFHKEPTLEEIEEYCRDDESSGCDLEMLTKLQAQKASSSKPAQPVRWSAEIDDAVFKTD
jgi:hypothetical protein